MVDLAVVDPVIPSTALVPDRCRRSSLDRIKARLILAIGSLAGLLVLLPACTSAAAPQAPTEEQVLIEAISNFGSSFGSNVIEAPVVVVPRSSNLDEVNAGLEGGYVAVHSSDDVEAKWRVVRTAQRDTHWEIDIETSDGSNLFAATILIGADSSGLLVVLAPEDVGVTPTSAIS